MDRLPGKLQQKLAKREEENAIRKPKPTDGSVDFSSNDYLGLAQDLELYKQAHELVVKNGPPYNGSTGSRLLTGHQTLADEVEEAICEHHGAEAALLFTSGYTANIGLLTAVAQKGDVLLYDRLSHASIREGVRLSLATETKYNHLDLEDLEQKLQSLRSEAEREIFIVTESVFSMDGDMPDLVEWVALAEKYRARLIVDEAHALGVVGNTGEGMVAKHGLQDRVFATILTYGKAAGAHGAAVLGSNELRTSLLNFSRSQIYTTALSPHSLASLKAIYTHFGSEQHKDQLNALQANIRLFREGITDPELKNAFIPKGSHIQACIIPSNKAVKHVAQRLNDKGFDIRPILSPTVARGKERLRISLHSFNQKEEIIQLLYELKQLLQHARKETGVYHDSRI